MRDAILYAAYGFAVLSFPLLSGGPEQWRTQEFFSGGGSPNSVAERGQNGDLGAVAP